MTASPNKKENLEAMILRLEKVASTLERAARMSGTSIEDGDSSVVGDEKNPVIAGLERVVEKYGSEAVESANIVDRKLGKMTGEVVEAM